MLKTLLSFDPILLQLFTDKDLNWSNLSKRLIKTTLIDKKIFDEVEEEIESDNFSSSSSLDEVEMVDTVKKGK
jgi:hypothetical protein